MVRLGSGLKNSAAATFGGLPTAFWWIWIATLVNRMGAFVLPFFAFYVTGPLHRSAALAGAVAALFGVGAAISSVVGGVLTDRVGRKPTLVVSLLANAATIIVLGYARSPWLLAAGALAVGLATNAARPAQAAMIADLVPGGERVRAYALNFWAINIGFSVSMMAVGLVTHFGYRTLFYADGASTVACALLIAIAVRDTTPDRGRSRDRGRDRDRDREIRDLRPIGPAPRAEGLGTVLRDRTFVTFVLASLVLMAVYDQCQAGLPMAMAADGMSAGTFGLIAAVNGVLIVLFQMPVTRRLKRHPDGRVLAGASVVIGAGFGLLAFGHSAAMYVLCVVVMTAGEIAFTPTGQAVSARLSPDHLRGRYQGVYQLSWTLASVVAPLVGGAVIGGYGGTPLWIGCFAVAGAAALVFVRIGAHVARRVTAAVSIESGGPAPGPEAAAA